MRIERLIIRNFRALEHVELELDPKMTVLIGANNVGKSSVLEALAAVLSFRRGGMPFSELDFRSADPNADICTAPSIQVDVHIAPDEGSNKFDPGELGSFTPQVRADGSERAFLRLEAKFDRDPSAPALAYTLASLRVDGTATAEDDLGGFPFREQLPLHAFGAERDLRRGLGGRWSDWGRIIADARPDETVRAEAMSKLLEGSEHLIANTPELVKIKAALGDIGTTIGLAGTTVNLMAAPQDVEELLGNVAIHLHLPGAGRGFKAERHGLGTQGALLFAIYRHHVARMNGQLSSVSPVLTIEEPEAHLHPTGQRAMAQQLAQLPGQVIVASHSPELLAAEKSRAVVLRSRGGKSVAYAATKDAKHYITANARALFARCILVVEGLEFEALGLCARAMKIDLAGLGVEVINAEGQCKINPIWEAFGPPGYDTPIVCLADADDPKPLDQFLNALHKAQCITQLPADSNRYAVLAKNHYFVAGPDLNIEEVLVAHDANAVDLAFTARGEDSFTDWKAAHARDRLGKERDRFAVRRGTSVQLTWLSELNDNEARVRRMIKSKGDGTIREVFRVLTDDGKDASRIPASFLAALNRVHYLAAG